MTEKSFYFCLYCPLRTAYREQWAQFNNSRLLWAIQLKSFVLSAKTCRHTLCKEEKMTPAEIWGIFSTRTTSSLTSQQQKKSAVLPGWTLRLLDLFIGLLQPEVPSWWERRVLSVIKRHVSSCIECIWAVWAIRNTDINENHTNEPDLCWKIKC